MLEKKLSSHFEPKLKIKEAIQYLEPDFEIVTKEGAIILVNKLLLSLSSPLLKNLLTGHMSSPDRIHLPDVSAPGLIHLINVVKNGFTTGIGPGYSVLKQIKDVAEILGFQHPPILTFEVPVDSHEGVDGTMDNMDKSIEPGDNMAEDQNEGVDGMDNVDKSIKPGDTMAEDEVMDTMDALVEPEDNDIEDGEINVKMEIDDDNDKLPNVKIVEKMKKVIKFLENVQITNEDALKIISKSSDDLKSSLKYLPTQPLFTNLPAEITTGILSYLCDKGAFVAATVCLEWNDILVKERLTKLEQVRIGKCCSNLYSCENNACFLPEELLNASITLKLNIPLIICYPVTNVDSKLLTKGLMSVSDFTLDDYCDCAKYGYGLDKNVKMRSVLDLFQMKYLFKCLVKEKEIDMAARRIEIISLNMTYLNQDMLTDYFIKINSLSLGLDKHGKFHCPILDFEMFIKKLLQVPIKCKLSKLSLDSEIRRYKTSAVAAVDLANALCRIESVSLGHKFPLRPETTERLIQNIIHDEFSMDWNGKTWHGQRSRIKRLFIQNIDWRTVMTPEDLKTLITKMIELLMCGRFTLEQMQAARSLPGVQVLDVTESYFKILKV